MPISLLDARKTSKKNQNVVNKKRKNAATKVVITLLDPSVYSQSDLCVWSLSKYLYLSIPFILHANKYNWHSTLIHLYVCMYRMAIMSGLRVESETNTWFKEEERIKHPTISTFFKIRLGLLPSYFKLYWHQANFCTHIYSTQSHRY